MDDRYPVPRPDKGVRMSEQKQKPHTSPRAAVGAIVIEKGKVLLVKRKYPPQKNKWAIPGGSVNLGETLHRMEGIA